MPALEPGHALDAVALLRARDDRRRRLATRARAPQRRHDLVQIVTVERDGAPAECREAPLVGFHVVAEHRGAGLAEAVDVHDRDEVGQPLVARHLRRFPDRALRRLAVAQQHEHAGVGPQHARP